jgi:hypothetical protein
MQLHRWREMVQRRPSGSGQRVTYEKMFTTDRSRIEFFSDHPLIRNRIAKCIMFELIFLLYLQVRTYRIRTHHITSERWMVETILSAMFTNQPVPGEDF